MLLLSTHRMRTVCLKPVQLMLLIDDHHGRVPSLLSQLSQCLDDTDKAVRIERGIVLLGEPQGPLFPIRHLLTLAHILAEEMLADLRESRLVGCDRDLAVVGLTVDEARKALVELHGREVPREDVQVALE